MAEAQLSYSQNQEEERREGRGGEGKGRERREREGEERKGEERRGRENERLEAVNNPPQRHVPKDVSPSNRLYFLKF